MNNPFEGEDMTLVCEAVINVLVEEYELQPIAILFDGRLGHTMGRAEYSTRTIRINKLIIPHWEVLHDTLLHEFAHFLTFDRGYHKAGHNYQWKDAAVEVGARPLPYQPWVSDNLKANAIRYMYECGKGCKIPAIKRRRMLERSTTFCTIHGQRLVRKDLY